MSAGVVFHAPCTLQHGQRLRGGVEAQLRTLGFEMVANVNESHLCCGSAGTYSITQAEISMQLRDRKLANLSAAEPRYIASANVRLHHAAAVGHADSGASLDRDTRGGDAMSDAVAAALLAAQSKAESLFAEVVESGLIAAGKLESELTAQIHALARKRYGLRRHWHKKVVRSGPNTLLTYHDDPADRRITDDDIVYLDFGPVFDAWEADFGRTYAVGSDPLKHRLVADIAEAFRRGKQLFADTPDLTAGQMYEFVAGLAPAYGWEFGAPTAGHLIGPFPHERDPHSPEAFLHPAG